MRTWWSFLFKLVARLHRGSVTRSTPQLTPTTTQHRRLILRCTLMTIFDYVDIPACATVLPPEANNRPDTKVQTSPPPASHATDDPASPSSAQGNTPTRAVFKNLPGLLLTSTLQIPTNALNENPRNVSQLLSTRDPLSVPTTTVNFRRFVSRVGPVFWLQDRIEEIVTWRKGWKVTVIWTIAYSFFCQLVCLDLLRIAS